VVTDAIMSDHEQATSGKQASFGGSEVCMDDSQSRSCSAVRGGLVSAAPCRQVQDVTGGYAEGDVSDGDCAEAASADRKGQRTVHPRQSDDDLSLACAEEDLRQVRSHKETLHSPQERRPLRQSPRKSGSLVHVLSQSDAQAAVVGRPRCSIGLIATDPPYGISYQSARRTDRSKWKPKIANDGQPYVWWLYDAYRLLEDGGGLLCFCRWDVQEAFRLAITWAGFSVRAQIIWDRVVHGMGDLTGTPGPQHDVIWFATKGRF